VHKKTTTFKSDVLAYMVNSLMMVLDITEIVGTWTECSTRTEDGYWRIKNKQEINDILKGQNMIRFIKKQRLNWLGHVERMVEDNIVQRIKS
jgi:hypothetical protein